MLFNTKITSEKFEEAKFLY